MTVCKRIGAWLLTLVLLVSALPYTAFAASEDSHVVNATMEETSVEDIASNVTTQLLRGAKTKDETLSMEAKPTHEDSDSVEIIVVVDDSVAKPAAQAQVQSLLQKQEKAAATMSRAIGEAVEPERQYTTLLNGFSATVTYGQYKALKELDCVESVFLSPTFSLLPDTANSTRMIGGGLANETGFTGEGMLIAILDTGVDMDHQIFSKAPANPALTQDDVKGLLSQYDFQAEGFVKGLSVSSVYKSAKFPFQFDYGDKDTDGAPGTKSSHGTHVASTAAGCTGINADVQGVAPDAQIANMNVFKSSGGASYADILSALEDCMLLGVDVANLSLGSDAGYIDYENPDEFTESLLNVFKRAGESGMSLAVAAGNAYSAAYGDAFGNKALASNPDYGLISEPSTYGESMSVAAVSNSKVKSPYITVGGRDFAYQDSGTISTDENAKIFRDLAKKGELKYAVVPGYGTEDDYEGIDVSGKVALVQRGGGMYHEQKERSAYAHGAIAMLVYNNVPGMLYMSITDWKMPCAFISQEAGEYLKAQENKVLTVGAADKLVASPTYGMADFSSWGATTELTLKPEITAPGAGIYAAVPGNAYESMDGTSMASPHAAGAMAIVQQALKARGMTDATQRKHMVDTLLMSTASIIYDSNGQPYSPRKQGAGLININDAVKTEGYLTVDGMIRPKLELGDDPAEKGVYTMTFKVHNTGKDTLYYDIQPIVLTDGTATYTNSDNEAFLTSSETAVALSHTFTTNCKDNRVAVPAGGEQEVTATVTLTNAKEELKNFENGAYVEGFVTLKQVAADGGKLEAAIDLGIPYLAFYGDWTKAPIIDSTDYWETLDGTESKAQAYMNTAFTTSAEGQIDTYLGDNNYANVSYFADHNAISPDNSNDMMDSLAGIYTGLLRNTKTLKYTITDQKTGEVYLEKTCDYVNKSIYSYDYYRIVPAGVNADYTGIDAWYGTAKNNSKLPNNTKATVTIEATLPYGDGGTKNLKNSWSFPITIDNEDPHASNLKVTEAEGRYYLSLDVSDNQYVSAIVFYNLRNSDLLYGIQGFSETTPGLTSHVKEYDVTGMGETFGMIVHDYAGNSKSYTVKVPGNSDDYGIVKPTNVLWTETFDNDWLPADWSMESKGASVNTWYRDVDYTATVDADDDFQQNEWLYSRATDISGVETDVHMIFNFYTTPVYTVDYKRCNLQVMASADGQTWEEVWNLQKDAGAFTAWAATQAKVTIPEKFQNCDDLRFAFVYTGKGGAQISVDNVQLYADVREDYIAVTATSGEGGAIDPAGTTLVKKGTSKTFNVVPATGYEVANVVVDGIDLGPIAYYTFERVGTDHTISATFQKAQAGGEIAIFSVLTTVAGEGGAVQPAGQTKVATGETVNVTFVPDEGYQLASVKVNGRKVEVTDNTYALTMDQNYAVTADFEAIPDVPQVMFENDFESVSGDKFPFHGWTVKGQDTNSTWKQYTYYNWKSEGNDSKHAYITNDWDGAQDEYLISPVVDLSATRDGVLTFDFAYGEYGIKNKTFTATVEVSTDGGKTWNAIWNFQDSYTGQQASNYIISGSAEVPVPAEYNVAGVQFAFRYVHPHEDTTGQLAIDNVKLMAVETGEAAQKYTIAATAGEGGSITPNGDVSVKEGASQTFAITADNGYEIADVLVDGNSVGAVETYTFDEVKANHTISASFSKTTSAAEFDNDFEQDEFPGHGWAVKSSRTDTPYTWYKGTNTTLNSSKQARIDMDYYESSGWGDWGSKSAQPLSGGSDKKQDEYLISPVVDLTGKTPTLSFDYLLHRYTAYNYCAFTVEASTDGGSTWTAIWNAKVDLAGMGGSYLSGTAKIEVPEAYLTGNVQFAFHLAKKAGVGYDDDDAMFAIDNVKLTNTDPCADGHAYGEPVWSWTDDFKATATFTCANNDAHVENVTATVTNAVTTEATCKADGVRTYTAKVTFEDKEYTDTKTETLPATGHAYGTPVWKWNDDYTASATFTCGNDASHVETVNAAVTNEVTTEATCEADGVRTYTAKVTFEGKEYTDTKTEPVPAKGHTLTAVEAVPATCETAGVKAHWVCSVCGKLFSDAGGKTETTMEKLAIPATGHAYGEPVWSWTDDFKATATFTCANNDAHVENVTATVTNAVTTEATCEADGVRTYTAKVTFGGKEYTDTKTEVIPATSHDTELVGAKDATCTEDGYTGDEVCKVCGVTVKQGEVIPALGHDYKDGKCSRCGAEEPTTPVEPGKPGDSGKPTTPEKPAEPSQPTTPDTPATGDSSNMTALWVVLAVAGLGIIALVVLLVTKRSKKQNG